MKPEISNASINSSVDHTATRFTDLTYLDSSTEIQTKIQPTNFWYGVGVGLRQAYEYLAEKLSQITFSLPGVGAAPSLVSELQFDYRTDKTVKGIALTPAEKRQKEKMLRNIENSFKSLRNEGPYTTMLIDEAVKGGVKFTIVDSKFAKQEIKKWQEIVGINNLGGIYNSNDNEIIIFATHEGKHSEGTIKHELIHYLETIFGKSYDAEKVSQCKKTLDEKLGKGAILCLNNPKAKGCDEVVKYAAEYHNRTVKKISNLVSYKPDTDNPNSGIIAILTINDNFPKLENNGAIVRVIQDGGSCTLKLESWQNLKSGRRRTPTSQEKDLFTMALAIAETPARSDIDRNHLRFSSKVRDSEHYAEVAGANPDRVLEAKCSDVIPASHKKLAGMRVEDERGL